MTFSKVTTPIILTVFVALSFMGSASNALAQELVIDAHPPIDILPAAQAEERGMNYDAGEHTHPPIKLTPDKSELVRLEKPAGSVIVGNPNHVNILADSATTLVLIPRLPGATHFTVLDKDGIAIMQRHIIVASPKEKYLRVRRSCAASDSESCQQTSVFYCPDMCHEIIIGNGEDSSSSGDPLLEAITQASQAANGNGEPATPADENAQ